MKVLLLLLLWRKFALHRKKSKGLPVPDKEVYVEYSADEDLRLVVHRHANYFSVRIEQKVYDDYYGEGWFQYLPIRDYMHIADSKKRAVEIGRTYFPEYTEGAL